MTGFSDFGLHQAILGKLSTIDFTTPTPIQKSSIPLALEGKDILGTAQTGTGKTAAFGLPLIHHLINHTYSSALVMAPTRELAMQVMVQLKSFIPEGHSIRSALLIGGEPMFKQLKQLQTHPRLIVGTPGRINDHLERDTLRLSKTDFLVLDEADRMLDMGFGVQLEAIAAYLPEKRQTLMFSATVPPNIMRLAGKYLTDPSRVETHQPHMAAPKIKQELIHVNDDGKHDQLVQLLDARSGQIIVFVKTKHGADRLARRLEHDNHSAEAIHGDLRQAQRDRVLKKFRKNDTRILVATDVAARGLDIPLLETVINYDLPQCPEDYIHRIGRTGRNGAEGEAICLISGQDRIKWAAIDRLMNPEKHHNKGGQSHGQSHGQGNRGNGQGRGGNRGPRSGSAYANGGSSSGKPASWKDSWKSKKSAPANSYSSSSRFDKPYGKNFDRKSEDGHSNQDGHFKKFDRSDRPQRFERSDRPERSERSERFQERRNDDRPRKFDGDTRPPRDHQPRDHQPRENREFRDQKPMGKKSFDPLSTNGNDFKFKKSGQNDSAAKFKPHKDGERNSRSGFGQSKPNGAKGGKPQGKSFATGGKPAAKSGPHKSFGKR